MFIVCESLVDNYAGRSEVASFLPALTFGVSGTINMPRLTARDNAESTVGSLNAPCHLSCFTRARLTSLTKQIYREEYSLPSESRQLSYLEVDCGS